MTTPRAGLHNRRRAGPPGLAPSTGVTQPKVASVAPAAPDHAVPPQPDKPQAQADATLRPDQNPRSQSQADGRLPGRQMSASLPKPHDYHPGRHNAPFEESARPSTGGEHA